METDHHLISLLQHFTWIHQLARVERLAEHGAESWPEAERSMHGRDEQSAKFAQRAANFRNWVDELAKAVILVQRRLRSCTGRRTEPGIQMYEYKDRYCLQIEGGTERQSEPILSYRYVNSKRLGERSVIGLLLCPAGSSSGIDPDPGPHCAYGQMLDYQRVCTAPPS